MKCLTVIAYSFALLCCIESQIRDCPHSHPHRYPPPGQIYRREKDLQPEASNMNNEKSSSDSDDDLHDGWQGGDIRSGNWWDGWVKGWFSSVKKEELKKKGLLPDNKDQYKNHNNLGGHKPGYGPSYGHKFGHIGGYGYGKYAPYKPLSYGKYVPYKPAPYGKYTPYKSASYASYYYKRPYSYGNYGYKTYYGGYKPYSYGHYGRYGYHPYPMPYGHIYGYRG